MPTPDWTSTKPFAGADDPETAICWDCGATWKRGQDGSHSCVAHLQTVARSLAEENAALKARSDDFKEYGRWRDAAMAVLERLGRTGCEALGHKSPAPVLEAIVEAARAEALRRFEAIVWDLSCTAAPEILAAYSRILAEEP